MSNIDESLLTIAEQFKLEDFTNLNVEAGKEYEVLVKNNYVYMPTDLGGDVIAFECTPVEEYLYSNFKLVFKENGELDIEKSKLPKKKSTVTKQKGAGCAFNPAHKKHALNW